MNRMFVKLPLYLACILTMFVGDIASARTKQKQILFVCTGNYYRSRFAEALFNQKARVANVNWHASSRGLNLVPWQIGISRYAKEELTKRNVPKELWSGTPKKLTKSDIAQSDCIILMDETEHRRLFEKKFPENNDAKVQYWHIPDSGGMKPAQACTVMSKKIDQLLAGLERDSK